MSSKTKLDWNKRTILIVTGASRGLGRCISLKFAEFMSSESFILLLARNRDNLISVQDEIYNTTRVKSVAPICFDLSNTDHEKCLQVLTSGMENVGLNKIFDQAILVNNAGTLGDVSQPVASLTSSSKIKEYFDINLHSVIALTSAFLSKFKEVQSRFVINISSLCAVLPFKGCALYCTGKAARDMFFKVLAEEEETVTVLNYGPGPLLTDMLTEMLNSALPEVKEKFYDENGKLRALTCDFTVSKLLSVLERSEFKSGDHVDVFDCE